MGLDPGKGACPELRERTNCGRGCSFSFFSSNKRISEKEVIVNRKENAAGCGTLTETSFGS